MVEKCTHVLARNFCHIYDVDYSFLQPFIFYKIISNKYLAVKSEFTLYKTVRRSKKKEEDGEGSKNKQKEKKQRRKRKRMKQEAGRKVSVSFLL